MTQAGRDRHSPRPRRPAAQPPGRLDDRVLYSARTCPSGKSQYRAGPRWLCEAVRTQLFASPPPPPPPPGNRFCEELVAFACAMPPPASVAGCERCALEECSSVFAGVPDPRRRTVPRHALPEMLLRARRTPRCGGAAMARVGRAKAGVLRRCMRFTPRQSEPRCVLGPIPRPGSRRRAFTAAARARRGLGCRCAPPGPAWGAARGRGRTSPPRGRRYRSSWRYSRSRAGAGGGQRVHPAPAAAGPARGGASVLALTGTPVRRDEEGRLSLADPAQAGNLPSGAPVAGDHGRLTPHRALSREGRLVRASGLPLGAGGKLAA